MIPQIEEFNFPEYATLSNATAQFSEMGDRIITTQVKIDGDIVPDFEGWELRFRGERFVLNVKDPQAAKDNTSRNSVIDLTFYSWPILQLKRYFFFTAPATATGVITVDKYQAPVTLTLANFGTYLNQVLEYYFHGKISADVYVNPADPNNEPAVWDINYTKIWDVLQKIYELYGVRWRIEYDESTDSYTIKINHTAPTIDDHEFQYGFQGGLMRFERQVQSGDITNILLGRGGTQNVPYRYFKRTDPENPEWAPDPDAIPELANLYIDRIRDINFRNYIQGWKTNPNRDTTTWSGTVVETYDEVRGATDWAYAKGHTDTVFDPVEYVKDDESILKYGEHWGHLDDDDDIYPTIQGVEVGGARADMVVAVSPITTDDIGAATSASAIIVDLSDGVTEQTNDIEQNRTGLNLQYEEIRGSHFTIPANTVASLKDNGPFIIADISEDRLAELAVVTDKSRISVFNASTNREVSRNGLTAGEYYYIMYIAIRNASYQEVKDATYGYNGLRLEMTTSGSGDEWKPTFDIWIRNIFETGQEPGESPEDYALRVWGPILGDHLGNEAAIAFSDGQMSISEDYTFKIAQYPVPDKSKTLGAERSEWKITLYKTDAEFDATGLYVPNATTGGRPSAGDHFYFIGIDMPHYYVLWAERRVNEKKTLALYGTSEISPTWVIGLDKVRLDQEYNEAQDKLFDKIEAGVKMYVMDKRFTKGHTLELYANSVTFTWSDDTVILPQTEVVLTDKIAVTKSQIAAMQGDISYLRSSVAQMSDTANIVRETMKPLFLGKTGEPETSLSPTRFSALVTSEDFQQGGFGGRGWGFYRDNSMTYQNIAEVAAPTRRMLRAAAPATRAGESVSEEPEEDTVAATPSIRAGSQSVLEVDRLVVRRDMQVNNLVINQIAYVGGKQIISAAAMECNQVVENDDSYDCFFDQKQGSIKNLFQVNDIAMGQVYTPENQDLRFYKRVVTKVGLDYIRLSKTEAYGSGVPKKGDVIVQFGNTVNKDRQYAIVRDVIGGGYEQMLSDLDTVYNDGEEYYFAGLNQRQNGNDVDLADNQDVLLADNQDKILTVKAGAKPRFYVGNADSHIDYNSADGIFRLKGNIVQSPSGVEFPVPCFRGEYDANTAYYYGDLVTYSGSSWIHIGKNETTGTTPETGNIWRLYTESGKPVVYGDLDNEMDAIGVGPDGILDVAIPKTSALTTTFRLYYGLSSMPLTALTVSGVPTGISYERVQAGGVYTGQVKFWAPSVPVNLTAGRYPITITGTANIDGTNVQYSCVYTLLGSKQGADGATFILVPNINAVKKTAGGVLSDAYITCSATDSTGTELDTYYIYYSRDGGNRALYKKRENGGTPTYGSGLSSGIPTNNITTNVKLYLYLSTTDATNHKYVDTETIPLLIDGATGRQAVSVYAWNNSATTAPSISGTAYPPTGWYTTAPNRPTTPGDHFLWMSPGDLDPLTNTVSQWGTPVRITGDKGTAGEDGSDMEYIYVLKAEETTFGNASSANPKPSVITKDKDGVTRTADYIATTDDFVPYGWSDSPGGVSVEYKYEYMSWRRKPTGTDERWGAFSDPIVWSHYGRNGMDGDGVEYVYIRTTTNVAPSIVNSADSRKDSQNRTYKDDEYLPLASGGSLSGNVECTDDPQGVSSTYKFEWVAKRTKGAPIAEGQENEGRREWLKYSGTMSLWANYAEKGDRGNPGKIMRGINEWNSTYGAGVNQNPPALVNYQGLLDDYDADHTFYDVVYRPGTTAGTKRIFYCQHEKKGSTWARNITPENETGTVADRCWIEAEQYEFVATRVFLANNAHIDFLTGNDIYVTNGTNVYAGVLGGTGTNFFAGPDTQNYNNLYDQADHAAFRVDNQGNLVATKATINGKIITGMEAAQSGSYGGSSLVSLNGLYVNSGATTLQSLTASGNVSMTSTGSSAAGFMKAKNGNNESEVNVTPNKATLKSSSSTNSAVMELFGGTTGDAKLNRNGGGAEDIVSSGDIKHIKKCTESNYPLNPDADTLYIIVSS